MEQKETEKDLTTFGMISIYEKYTYEQVQWWGYDDDDEFKNLDKSFTGEIKCPAYACNYGHNLQEDNNPGMPFLCSYCSGRGIIVIREE